jgi:hypothetical protein
MNITKHAFERMSERGITVEMLSSLLKGKNISENREMEDLSLSGKLIRSYGRLSLTRIFIRLLQLDVLMKMRRYYGIQSSG